MVSFLVPSGLLDSSAPVYIRTSDRLHHCK